MFNKIIYNNVTKKRRTHMKETKKFLGIIAIAAIIGLGFNACDDEGNNNGGGNNTIPVTGVTLNKTTLALTVGSADALVADIAPSNASNTNVTWSTSNASVATVNNGTVNAISAGTATITVTTTDGGKTATCAVTVTAVGASVAVTGVTLNKTMLALTVGGSDTLIANIAPSNATNTNVTWISSNASVATVSNGTVTAAAVGTAAITVTTTDGGKTATCTVTVTAVGASVPVTGVTLNKTTLALTVGGADTLVEDIAPSNATNTNVTWSSSNTSVATVNNGTVTAATAGTATITVTTADGGKTATCAVTVTGGGDPIIPGTGSKLTVNGLPSGTYAVYVFTSGTDVSTYDAITNAYVSGSYQAVGAAVTSGNSFNLIGWNGTTATTAWTGSGNLPVLLFKATGSVTDTGNPMYSYATVNFSSGNGTANISNFTAVVMHTHTYSTTWSSNATQHWKECTVAGCDAKTETADHTLAYGICTTCGYDTHIHTFSTTWSSDVTQHWKECTDAGCDVKTGTANHAPSNSICTTCGYDNTPIEMEMVQIPAGTFTMGTVSGGNDDERPVRQVTLSAFKMGKYEVTQEQYQEVMGENPSSFGSNPAAGELQGKRPVENVTWFDAIEFCNKLSVKEGLTPVYTITGRNPSTGYPITDATVSANWSNNGYRLPTEAQWEYACRAGSTTDWTFGNDQNQLINYAWYGANSNYMTHQVGKKTANAWGLYDMHGNVYEWCWDWFGSSYYGESGNTNNPMGPASGPDRVRRGGSWFNSAGYTRSAYRFIFNIVFRNSELGFRVVRP